MLADARGAAAATPWDARTEATLPPQRIPPAALHTGSTARRLGAMRRLVSCAHRAIRSCNVGRAHRADCSSFFVYTHYVCMPVPSGFRTIRNTPLASGIAHAHASIRLRTREHVFSVGAFRPLPPPLPPPPPPSAVSAAADSARALLTPEVQARRGRIRRSRLFACSLVEAGARTQGLAIVIVVRVDDVELGVVDHRALQLRCLAFEPASAHDDDARDQSVVLAAAHATSRERCHVTST